MFYSYIAFVCQAFFLKQTESKFRYHPGISKIYKNSKQAASDDSISVEAECDLNHVCYLFGYKTFTKKIKTGRFSFWIIKLKITKSVRWIDLILIILLNEEIELDIKLSFSLYKVEKINHLTYDYHNVKKAQTQNWFLCCYCFYLNKKRVFRRIK